MQSTGEALYDFQLIFVEGTRLLTPVLSKKRTQEIRFLKKAYCMTSKMLINCSTFLGVVAAESGFLLEKRALAPGSSCFI